MKDKELKKLIKEAEAQSKKEQVSYNNQDKVNAKDVEAKAIAIEKRKAETPLYVPLGSKDYEVLDQMDEIFKKRRRIKFVLLASLYAFSIFISLFCCFLSIDASQSVLKGLSLQVVQSSGETAYDFIANVFKWIYEILPFIFLGVSIVFFSLAFFNFYRDREYKYLHQDEITRKRIFSYIVVGLAVIYLIIGLVVSLSNIVPSSFFVEQGLVNESVMESFIACKKGTVITTIAFSASLILMFVLGRLSHKISDRFPTKIYITQEPIL